MRDRDKPFVMYRRGPGNFTIVPRGVVGWFQFAVWIALFAALTVWFVDHVGANGDGGAFYDGLALFGVGVIAWLIAGLWWMIARAEIIDIAELMRDRQMAARKRRREG
jgi:hypothetical protein